MNYKPTGHIYFISGPSGAGKGTVIDHLRQTQPDCVFPPSCTTREPRPGEVEGETYFFLTPDQFDEKVTNGDFLEWAWVHEKNRYGTLREKLITPAQNGKTVIREFDVQGFMAAQAALPRELYTGIFIKPAGSIDDLRERIIARAPMSNEELGLRMESLRKELASAAMYDHVVLSYHGEQSRLIADIEAIINAS